MKASTHGGTLDPSIESVARGGTNVADSNEPMIKLEPNGTAPILSYNVPEPTSYAGRSFIDLQLPASTFVATSQTPAPDGSATVTPDSPLYVKQMAALVG